MVLERGKYDKKLMKLAKLRDIASFKALVEKLLKLTGDEPEQQLVILKAACINAARLKLWFDGYTLASQFVKTSEHKDPQVICILAECAVHCSQIDHFDEIEFIVTSYLRRSGVEASLDDIDVAELQAIKAIPSLPQATRPKKRKHKPLYPKGFDPEKPGPPADPERWLPKNQRTKQPKKPKKSSTGFQGSASGSAAPAISTAQLEPSKERKRRK